MPRSNAPESPWTSPNVRSPVVADATSLARGEEIYQTAGCAACHGDTGRGDGPAGLRPVPRPADFRVHINYIRTFANR